MKAQIAHARSEGTDWARIFAEWQYHHLPLDDWYLYPDYLIYERWAGIKEVDRDKANEANYSTAVLASMIYNAFRDQNKTAEMGVTEFLPYSVEEKYTRDISPRTARIFVALRDRGLIPPNILAVYAEVPGLYESIIQLSRE